MSRAVLLVTSGDPFLNAYWFRNYRTWAQHTDELRIVICDMPDPRLRAYMAECIDGLNVASMEFWPRSDHGIVIGHLMALTKADTIMLCEEDVFVRQPDAIGERFARIERGEVDLIGCPRGNGTPGIIAYANARFGEQVAETDEQGPIYWPCLLWAKRTDLERTDRNYSVWGDTRAFDHTFEREQNMDTFGWASLQLRALGLRVGVEGNYRADLVKMPGWGGAPWFHVGGLSTGFGLYIMGPRVHDVTWLRDTDLTDWAKRVAFWQILADSDAGPDWLRDDYRAGIAAFVAAVGMRAEDISHWRGAFERLL